MGGDPVGHSQSKARPAVTRFGEARRTASSMISSSIKFSLVGRQVGCTMKTSWPRTESMISTRTSPSLNRPTRARASDMLRWRAISRASGGLALPENTIIESDGRPG